MRQRIAPVPSKKGSPHPAGVALNRLVQPKTRNAAALSRYPNVVQRAAVRRSLRIAAAGYVHQNLPLIGGFLIAATTIDKHGNQYWNGFRSGLGFDGATRLAMAGSKAHGCQIGKPNCTAVAISIDHITDFATTQSALATHTYCDGAHHWTGVLLTDVKNDYNNLGNLQWACTSCNSSKGGVKGLYAPPRHAGQCPGLACTL
jgi:hypothetical protein